LTEQFRLEPMSDVCPSTECGRRAPRHSVCAGSVGSPVPQRWMHGGGAGDDEIGIACECRAALWLVGEGDLYALTPREWKAAVLDLADLGHNRTNCRARREARAPAKCIAVLRSAITDEPVVANPRTNNSLRNPSQNPCVPVLSGHRVDAGAGARPRLPPRGFGGR
jgi:uncharacterized protein YjeT (DUF2065 family)